MSGAQSDHSVPETASRSFKRIPKAIHTYSRGIDDSEHASPAPTPNRGSKIQRNLRSVEATLSPQDSPCDTSKIKLTFEQCKHSQNQQFQQKTEGESNSETPNLTIGGIFPLLREHFSQITALT